MKRCPRCGEEKPLTAEYWNRNRSTRNGFEGWCKKCKKGYTRAYRQRPEVKEWWRAYQRTYQQAWRRTAKEWKAYNRAYQRTYRRGERQLYQQRLRVLRYLARAVELPDTLTAEHQEVLLSFYKNRCAYCRARLDDDLHWEHIIPLSEGRAGTEPINMVPSCRSCNVSKGASPVRQFLEQGTNSEGRVLVGHREFRANHLLAIACLNANKFG